MTTPDKTFLHLDMDAFFAAVEQRDNPELRGKPVIVGSPPDARGVVATCSYEARQFGVHSAMPSRTAYKLCPQAIFVRPNGEKYRHASRQIRDIFHHYTPLVEPLSIDEAFLDITGSLHLFGDAVDCARQLKQEIFRATRLTASVGVAPNKFLAKLASDMQKPDGLTVVPREAEAIAAFLAPLPVTRIWGIGKKSAERLHRAGIRLIGDLQRADRRHLIQLLGEKGGSHAHRLAFGDDPREITLDAPEKSVSNEHTFGEDCRDWETVERTLQTLVQKVGRRLRQKEILAATAHLKLRWSDFTTITRQLQLPRPTHADQLLLEAARDLLAAARQGRAVRLIGFGTSNLQDEDAPDAGLWQPDLFGEAPTADEPEANSTDPHQLDHALDKIRESFGDGSIRRGT